MPDQLSPEVAFLKTCVPLRDLPDALIVKVARLSRGVTLLRGNRLVVPEDPDAPFYMVLEGKLRFEQDAQSDQPARVLKQGEFFGANAVLYGKSRKMVFVAEEPTRLIKIGARPIAALLKQEPALQASLRDASIMYNRLHSKHFRWVDPEETIQEILHEHPVYLMVGLLQGVGIVLFGVLFSVVGAWTGSVALTTMAGTIGLVIILIGMLWGLWQYIDWDNDYYVVTDRRIAWVEQVFGLYDSRNEILLSEVRSVEPETNFLGRILKYADLYIKDNFQRVIVFKHIRQHLKVKKAIELLSVEAQKKQSQLDRSVVDRTMRTWITAPAVPVVALPTVPTGDSIRAKKKSVPQRMQEYFDFRMRLVDGNTIIYRRHLIFLAYRTAFPFAIGIGVMVLMVLLIQARLVNTIIFPSVLATLLMGLLILVVCAVWAGYHFEDWRNDTYQITPDKIIVRQKKPLDVDRRSDLALLLEEREEVIGLAHRRATFMGVIFNYGEVFLSVKIPGETQLRKMRYVFDPARVHQDIFDRVYIKKRKKAQDELVRTGQLKDWFGSYHRQAEELRRQHNRDLDFPESGVK